MKGMISLPALVLIFLPKRALVQKLAPSFSGGEHVLWINGGARCGAVYDPVIIFCFTLSDVRVKTDKF